jgi:thiamine-monophosphate kinase
MKLADIGEFGLIHRIAPQFLENVKENVHGIGDDCAVIPQNHDESLLVTTDLLVEDIHFLRHKISAFELGHKSLAVNLSDIAAMGGTPTAAFLSIALPKDISVEWLDDFFAGLNKLSRETSTPLLGGDTTKSAGGVIINIAVLGTAHNDVIKYRSTAKPGDVICVTDFVGDSGGGLNIILNNLEDASNPDVQALITAHFLPRPFLAEGRWLAQQAAVHAMLDVSDGIDSDIQRIMEESQVGAHVNIEHIPISDSLKTIAAQHHWNATEIAATGGEDYCLLCTIAPGMYDHIRIDFEREFGNPLFCIGEITDGHALTYFQDGQKVDFAKHGWDHFK